MRSGPAMAPADVETVMRRSIACLALAAVLPLVAACGSLGDRSTVAELAARCEARNGTLVRGDSAAEAGLTCLGPDSDNLASPGAGSRRGQMNAAVDNAMRNGTPRPN